jgi:flavorubredoxin
MSITISENIKYIGVDDKDIDLFESQYIVPNGVSYNSYLIDDEKIAIMDTCDARKSDKWLENLKNALGDRKPDYLVISHLEPDHSGSIKSVLEEFADIKFVMSVKAKTMINQFCEISEDKIIAVKEGDELNLGSHTLKFIMAPMVHWPEVMLEYETSEKILFSADAFGKFGTLDTDEDWTCEARRYYFNIVGKYGTPVQTLLKKASALEIEKICPLHGPVLTENIQFYVDKYNIWSKYEAEDKGIFIAYASIHGNTKSVALKLKEILESKTSDKIAITDLSRDDQAEAVEDAFRYDRMILLASSYDGGVFPPMEIFLNHLKSKAYQNRKIALVENGSWAPSANKTMRSILESMKNIEISEKTVTIRTTLKDADISNLEELADDMV